MFRFFYVIIFLFLLYILLMYFAQTSKRKNSERKEDGEVQQEPADSNLIEFVNKISVVNPNPQSKPKEGKSSTKANKPNNVKSGSTNPIEKDDSFNHDNQFAKETPKESKAKNG